MAATHEGKDRKKMFSGGLKMFSVHVINKLYCHQTEVVLRQYISCSEVGFSHLNHVAGTEIMIQLIVSSVSLVRISRKPKAKRHWQCKYLWIYCESYLNCNIQQAYYISDVLLISCSSNGYRDCRSHDSHASILLSISPLYTPSFTKRSFIEMNPGNWICCKNIILNECSPSFNNGVKARAHTHTL